jgi:hypothetical protein
MEGGRCACQSLIQVVALQRKKPILIIDNKCQISSRNYEDFCPVSKLVLSYMIKGLLLIIQF